MKIIDEEADKLTDLIEQLMDVVQMQVGTFRIKPTTVRIETIVEKTMPQLQISVAQHRFETTFPADLPPVFADQQRIGQVLVNLVGNAAKFSPLHSLITITGQRTGDCVQISVSDEGRGIPPSDRALVFEVFHQVASEGVRQPGSGLGLTICRGLVEAHGGTIWVEDRSGPGTTIAFTLPISSELPSSL
jgi:two-component system sensor histidine kinase KdpD